MTGPWENKIRTFQWNLWSLEEKFHRVTMRLKEKNLLLIQSNSICQWKALCSNQCFTGRLTKWQCFLFGSCYHWFCVVDGWCVLFLCRLMIFEPHTVPMNDCCETVTVQYITVIVIYLWSYDFYNTCML